MQAVILAGGKGTRLRPITYTIPKALVPIRNKPIIAHTLDALPAFVTEVMIVIGYLGDQIREHCGTIWNGKSIVYIEQKDQCGTGHALKLAKPHLKDQPFFLLNGDDVYNGSDLIVPYEKTPCVFVARSENPERFGVCIVEGGRLSSLIEKPQNPPTNLVSIGAFILDSSIFSVSAPTLPNGESNLAGQVGLWASRKTVYIHETKFWYPINNLEELNIAEGALRMV